MNYWHSLLLICSWMMILTLCGRALTRLLPARGRSVVCFHLSPALGLGFFVLVATGLGWLVGARTWVAVPITLLATGIALGMERNWVQLARHLAWAVCAGSVVSLGPLLTVYLYSGYNVYNDTFTYLVHAQWLQTHAFREEVNLTILNPAYTQVSLYQIAGLRMGASFFLGWVQAASPLGWSIYIYPSVIAIALTAGAQAIGGLARILCPGRSRVMPLVWSLVAGTSVSGLTYGCFMGFLPQIFGLSLCTALIALLICFRPAAPRTRPMPWLETLPLAMVFSALGFAYSELLPFATVTLAGWFAVHLILERNRASWSIAAVRFAVWSLLLLNFECRRILRALAGQAKAVVGWPFPWSPADFAAHALGLHSGLGDGDWWMMPPAIAGGIARGALIVLLSFAIMYCWQSRRRLMRWSAPLMFLGICGTAFVFFRYFVHSPWPVGTGQSWNQFKLSNWSSPVLFAAGGAGLLWLSRYRATAVLTYAMMAAWLGINLHTHLQLAPERIRETLRLTGKTKEPFTVYEAIRADALAAKPQGVIFLDLGGSEHKGRQIAAYFLHDFQVAGDWTGDGYISSRLPAGWESLSPATSQWWVHHTESNQSEPGSSADHGALVFSTPPNFRVTPQEILGGHGVESDASGWWVWSPDHLKVRLKIYGDLPAQVCVKLTCIAAAEPRQLTFVAHANGRKLLDETTLLSEGWQTYSSAPFKLESAEIEIDISSHSAPIPIGATDSRQVTFLAKNVRLELLPPSP